MSRTKTKTQRRDTGTGALYQRADGLWIAAVTLPDVDGKRRRKVITSKRKSVVQDKLRVLRAELDKHGDLSTNAPTLEVWLHEWIEEIAFKTLKRRTYDGYKGYIEAHLVPALGAKKIDKITPKDVRNLHKRFETKGLSSTTALQAHNILARALKVAKQEGKIPRVVTDLVDKPRTAVSTRKSMSVEDAQSLLQSIVEDDDAFVQAAIALLGGLRQSERLGLTHEYMDLEAGTFTVAWTLQRLKWDHGCGTKIPYPCGRRFGGDCLERHMRIPAGHEGKQVYGGLWMTRPKSKAGWRETPIAYPLLVILREYFKDRAPGVEGIAFHRGDGFPIDHKVDRERWKLSLEAAELPHVPLHSARHTTATLLHALNVDEPTRIAILGHASGDTTAKYTHVSNQITRDAMEKLGALLLPPDAPKRLTA